MALIKKGRVGPKKGRLGGLGGGWGGVERGESKTYFL